MVKKLGLFLLIMLVPLLTAKATPMNQEINPPAALLPANTWLYAEIPLDVAHLQTLNRALLPFDLFDWALLTDLMPLWAGDQMGVAVLEPEDSLLPGFALLVSVQDEAAADEWVVEQADQHTFIDMVNYSLWLPEGLGLGVFVRTPGYVIMTDDADAAAQIGNVLNGSLGSLQNDFYYERATRALSSNPALRLYEGFNNSSLAFYAIADQLSIEQVQHEDYNALGVPAPLNSAAVEGVPDGALFVDTGMNADIALQTDLIDIPLLPDQNAFFTELMGAPLTDILTMVDGSYAIYLGYGRGAFYDQYGVPLEGGLILAPQNPIAAALVARTVTLYLRDTYDLDITELSPVQYQLQFPEQILPDLISGVAQNRLYVSTASGAEDIIGALADRNLTSDPRWQRVLEAAPVGTQRVQYINLDGLVALVKQGILTTMPELNNSTFEAGFAYLERFESAAIFHRTDEEGVALKKYVLLLAE